MQSALPSGAHAVLDLPSSGIITTPLDQLWGWIRVNTPVMNLRFTTLGRSLTHARIIRSDLDPDLHAGFSIYLDISELVPVGENVPDQINVECFDGQVFLCEFKVGIVGLAASTLDAQRINKIKKEEFVRAHCKIRPQRLPNSRAPSALPSNWTISPLVSEKRDPVSSHFYGPTVQKFLAGLDEKAMILDAGAGFRKLPYPNVINLEIYDYPSTDILAAAERLPFRDSVFDAVLSLAVLEHVKDPFACAREIRRVLKPGGKVLAMVPFLQAEHGYPSHYFNATRFGVRELFEGMKLETQFLEPSNLPIFTLNQILGLYASGLKGDARDSFLSLTTSDLISRPPTEWLNDKIVTQLAPETAWLIAWGTTTIFSKTPSTIMS